MKKAATLNERLFCMQSRIFGQNMYNNFLWMQLK